MGALRSPETLTCCPDRDGSFGGEVAHFFHDVGYEDFTAFRRQMTGIVEVELAGGHQSLLIYEHNVRMESR